jgi:hypothetical protein
LGSNDVLKDELKKTIPWYAGQLGCLPLFNVLGGKEPMAAKAYRSAKDRLA